MISDIHIDYKENRNWLDSLSHYDYINDGIILAGDVSENITLIEEAFQILSSRFKEVFYVPGNHDLWVRFDNEINSFMKFQKIKKVADNYGIHMKPFSLGCLSIIPLLSWYDYTFGEPDKELINSWSDYFACRWPKGKDMNEINDFFISMNHEYLKTKNEKIISFSHFMPSISLLPSFIPSNKRFIYPVMGSALLMEQIKKLGSFLHVYGHSHINVHVKKEGVVYINNAFGYPHETLLTSKKLKCIHIE